MRGAGAGCGHGAGQAQGRGARGSEPARGSKEGVLGRSIGVEGDGLFYVDVVKSDYDWTPLFSSCNGVEHEPSSAYAKSTSGVRSASATKPSRVEKAGPWGGKGGNSFDTKTVSKILGFEVWYDDFVTGIRFNYEQEGFAIWTPVYGSQSGGSNEKVQIGNSLTGIRVTVDSKDNLTDVVQSITLLAGPYVSYGPYGSSGKGKPYTANGTNIVGFFGHSAELINAIGIYIIT